MAIAVEDQALLDFPAVGVDAGFLRAYLTSGRVGPDITNREVAQWRDDRRVTLFAGEEGMRKRL
jgi:hypothetical protein